MRIYGKWILVACLALISGPAIAKISDPVPEPLETVTTMHVDGQILIDAEGGVDKFDVATKIAGPLEGALLRLVKQWRFNPIVIDGQARMATARMRVTLAAVRNAGGYRVNIDNVVFPNDEEFKASRVVDPEFITGRYLDKPIYPIVLYMHGVSGSVLLAILVGPEGRAKQVTATQSMLFDTRGRDPELRKAISLMETSAKTTARRWTFNVPSAKKGSSAADMTVYVPVEYVLEKKAAPGQWRSVVRVPKRAVAWLPESDPASAVGVADIASGEIIPVVGSLSLAIPVIGAPVM